MKKLSALALFIFYASYLIAQAPTYMPAPPPKNKAKFKGGIMISPSVGWLQSSIDDPRVNKITSPNAQIGFAYGLVGDFFFNNNYGIDINPRYNGFNEQFTYTPDINKTYSVDRTVHLQYIEVPVTLKMRTNEVGYMKYFAQIGIMPAVKIGGKLDLTEYSGGTVTNSFTGLNNTNNNDLNLFMLYSVIGLGAEYNLGGSTNIVGSITWNNGFTNVWNKALNQNATPSSYSYGNTNFNTPPESIMLNVGVLF